MRRREPGDPVQGAAQVRTEHRAVAEADLGDHARTDRRVADARRVDELLDGDHPKRHSAVPEPARGPEGGSRPPGRRAPHTRDQYPPRFSWSFSRVLGVLRVLEGLGSVRFRGQVGLAGQGPGTQVRSQVGADEVGQRRDRLLDRREPGLDATAGRRRGVDAATADAATAALDQLFAAAAALDDEVLAAAVDDDVLALDDLDLLLALLDLGLLVLELLGLSLVLLDLDLLLALLDLGLLVLELLAARS